METDDKRCRQFFLEPTETYHRQYEALRAFFIEGRRLQEIAQQFGYQESSLRSMVCRFRAQVQTDDLCPFLFDRNSDGPQAALALLRQSRRKRQKLPTDER
ncbi:MAG: hypothetical protein MOB07_13100 [Acidobacteria bacterium]|nr:hypothetical protein [Acidobacteriota bacterium]